MAEEFDGRIALVTGASRGIGRRIAERFADAGARVFAVARDAARLRALATSMTRGAVLPVPADLLTPDAMEILSNAVPEIDLLVHCAAAPLRHVELVDLDDESWDQQIALNLTVPRRLITWSASRMRHTGGSMTFISSVAARRPHHALAAYGASKAGLEALVRSAALELGSLGIRCNCVAPGLVETERTREVIARPDIGELQRATTPLGRLSTADDVAGVVMWLASEPNMVTGQTITCDGGRTIGDFRLAASRH